MHSKIFALAIAIALNACLLSFPQSNISLIKQDLITSILKYEANLIELSDIICEFGETAFQENGQVFIEAKISEISFFSKNLSNKEITKDEIIFYYGNETLGEINEFIFNKCKDSVSTITNESYKALKLSSIKDLNKELVRKNSFKLPNTIFKNINIVEIDKGIIRIYRNVYWEKTLYLE